MFVPGAGVADDQSEEIQDEKRNGSDEALHRKCKEVKREHVEQQVPDIGVHEATQYHRVVLPFRQELVGTEKTHVDDTRRLKQSHQTDADGQYHD